VGNTLSISRHHPDFNKPIYLSIHQEEIDNQCKLPKVKMKKHLIRFFITALFLLSFTAPATAQSNIPVISFQPGEINLGVGQSREIAISIENASELYGVEIHLSFDPKIIEIEDAESGSESIQISLGTFLDPGLILENKVDNNAGTVNFVMTQRDPSLPKSGSGILLVLKIRGKSSGMSQLTVTRALLADQNGNSLTPQINQAMVTISTQVAEGQSPTEFPKGDTSSAVIISTLQVENLDSFSESTATISDTVSPNVTISTPVNQKDPGSNSSPKGTGTLFVQYGWILGVLLIIILVLTLLNCKRKA
jgi:hypothetical protein